MSRWSLPGPVETTVYLSLGGNLGDPAAAMGAALRMLDDDPATRKLIAAAVAAEQAIDLLDRGVTNFHFYTMNRADLVYAICHLLGLRAAVQQAA